MADSSAYSLLILVFFFGVTAFYLVVRYGKAVAGFYESRVIDVVDVRLKKSFVDSKRASLLLFSVFSILFLTLIFYLLLNVIGGIVGFLVGLCTPWIYQYVLRKRRMKRFIYQLPDALSSLAGSLRSGSSLSKGLEVLANRQPSPLCEEFGLIVAESRVGRDLADSLKDMAVKLKSPELDLFTTAVLISRGVGGNLADMLDALAETLREKAQVEGKIAALTATGRAQGWVVSLLPLGVGIVLYLQQPEKMSVLIYEPWGWVVLGVITVMMAIAVRMIYKIVNIDV